MNNVKEILKDLGYSLKEDNGGWRSKRIYANGDNPTSLKIFPDGRWIDFVEQETGKLEDLISKTTGEETKSVKSFLKSKGYTSKNTTVVSKPKIKVPKYFDESEINDLKQDHSYWLKRGISLEVLKLFRGGIYGQDGGKLKNRYVFPIFKDQKEEKIVGYAARSLNPKAKVYWKLLGAKSTWVNFGRNHQAIKSKRQAIIVESIGDGLSLVQAGFENVLPLYGVDISNEKITYLIKLNPDKIIISLNNDENKNNTGNFASEKVFVRLKRYFDKEKITIKLPNVKGCKDWNEVLLKYRENNIKDFFYAK